MKQLLTGCLFAFILNSCNKSSDSDSFLSNTSTNTIDVSAQWIIDDAYNIVYTPGDSQWHKKVFTLPEQNLFNSLDTMDLSGTTTPDSVIEFSPKYNSIYPNPGNASINFSTRFYWLTNPYFGQYVFKCVIVDSLMNPLYKKAARLMAIPAPGPSHISSAGITITPTLLPPGRFRMYYTFSSQSQPNFYSSWGNLQRN